MSYEDRRIHKRQQRSNQVDIRGQCEQNHKLRDETERVQKDVGDQSE